MLKYYDVVIVPLVILGLTALRIYTLAIEDDVVLHHDCT